MSIDIRKVCNDSRLDLLLNRDLMGKGSNYVEVGPENLILPEKFEESYGNIKNFEVRDDDVYILAFPKTGSRLTQEMVWLLLNDLDFAKAREVLLVVRSPVLEHHLLYQNQPIADTFFDYEVDLKKRRCIKSHLHWSLLPTALTSGVKNPKMIVTLRCPEDTCTSYFHHCRIILEYTGSWEKFCELFLGGKVPLGPYWAQVMSMWEQRHKPNIMFIKYNRMISDLAGTIREVASFIGKDLSDDQVKEMCEHLKFDNLKKSKGFNMEEAIKMNDCNPYIRKGTAHDHKNVMPPETIEAFIKQKEKYLLKSGLTFD